MMPYLEWLPRVLMGFAAGSLAGAVFFLSLWWTVARLRAGSRLGLFVVVSYLARMALVLGALALLAVYGGVAELLGGVAGILAARWVAVRRVEAGGQREVAEVEAAEAGELG